MILNIGLLILFASAWWISLKILTGRAERDAQASNDETTSKALIEALSMCIAHDVIGPSEAKTIYTAWWSVMEAVKGNYVPCGCNSILIHDCDNDEGVVVNGIHHSIRDGCDTAPEGRDE